MTVSSWWAPPPQSLVLEDGEVHVWRASLQATASGVNYLYGLLDIDERSRAERFYFHPDRVHFIAGRGILKIILGRYLDTDARQLRFCYNLYGKPAIARQESLTFNVAHSDGLALYAIARNRRVGIDIERIHADFACEPIAQHYFSAREYTTLCALPPAVRPAAFFTCWTRKEAFVKARGEGLSMPLDQFDVSVIPGGPAILTNAHGNPGEVFGWVLRDLFPGRGYAAALAVEAHGWVLSSWQFDHDGLYRL